MTYLLIILFSIQSFAIDWSELETQNSYKLNHQLDLPLENMNSTQVNIPIGDDLVLNEIMGLGQLRLTLFKFTWLQCFGKDMRSEMILLKVLPELEEIGVLLEKNCQLEFYVENVQLNSKSVLR